MQSAKGVGVGLLTAAVAGSGVARLTGLCIHIAQLSWLDELIVDDIPILDAAALRPALQVTRQALSPGQVDLGCQVRVGFQQATYPKVWSTGFA